MKGMVNTMTKLTYAMAIDSAINGNITDEVREKLEALKTQLAKRNSGERKPTKTQRENEGIKGDILEVLGGEGRQCKDIAEEIGISGQKCSALLSQLIAEGKVEKTVVKRVSYFKAVA